MAPGTNETREENAGNEIARKGRKKERKKYMRSIRIAARVQRRDSSCTRVGACVLQHSCARRVQREGVRVQGGERARDERKRAEECKRAREARSGREGKRERVLS